MAQKPSKPLMGICEKCGTENSELFEYDGRYLCKANECLTEELERDSERHILLNEKLENYKKLVAGTL